jgi:hypothetical protein
LAIDLYNLLKPLEVIYKKLGSTSLPLEKDIISSGLGSELGLSEDGNAKFLLMMHHLLKKTDSVVWIELMRKKVLNKIQQRIKITKTLDDNLHRIELKDKDK